MKMDGQLFDILEILFKFLIIQIGVFWFCLLIPSKENYHLIQDSSYKVQTYESPKQINLVKGKYKQAYLLILNDQTSGKEVLTVDCTPLITDHIVAKFCSIFFNQKIRVLSVDLYERYTNSEHKMASKIKSVVYKDLDGKINKADFWASPYKAGVEVYKEKNKFIFYTLLDLLFLLGFMWVITHQKFILEKFYEKRTLMNRKIFNAIKVLSFLLMIGQVCAIFYYLLSNL